MKKNKPETPDMHIRFGNYRENGRLNAMVVYSGFSKRNRGILTWWGTDKKGTFERVVIKEGEVLEATIGTHSKAKVRQHSVDYVPENLSQYLE